MACFAPDAVQMPPNDPPNIGDDWAFERGTYRIALTPKAGGTPIRDTGKYLTIYRRQTDHSWLMARDIWNSNNPLPSQA